ncbi:TetR family transcriptional regulator [Gryllotalpicola reticulitermitis]|uniref:TetR family transcriptional regulator n=1 Tax=Gryllotalpicola reticulitermitis TaxID=1184153 RepID=A0ABV8Q9F4_9MICO
MSEARTGGAATGRAEATQQRILDAAFDEFSTRGVAGARVDRVARAAGCNKNLIYIYFGSKEGLFEATLKSRLKLVYEDHPLTPENLPEYAGKTFDFAMENPDVIRLLAWTKLDPDARQPQAREHSIARKTAMLREAQSDGTLTDAWSPEFLMTFVMSLATAWVPAFPYGIGGGDRAAIREQIVRAVRAVVSAGA